MTIRLLNAHCFVKPDAPIKNIGGVLIPEASQKRAVMGTVKAVGNYYFSNGEKMSFDLEVGDRVMYRPFDGDLYPVDGEELLLLGLAQLIGVVDSDEDE